MSNKEYCFSKSVEKWSLENSSGFSDNKKKNTHHIVPRSVAKKYHLPKDRIKSRDNAIALEIDTFHAWLHGFIKTFGTVNTIGWLDAEMKDLERSLEVKLDDNDWRGLEESDYIELAISLLGIPEECFDKAYPRTYKKKKKKKRKKR